METWDDDAGVDTMMREDDADDDAATTRDDDAEDEVEMTRENDVEDDAAMTREVGVDAVDAEGATAASSLFFCLSQAAHCCCRCHSLSFPSSSISSPLSSLF